MRNNAGRERGRDATELLLTRSWRMYTDHARPGAGHSNDMYSMTQLVHCAPSPAPSLSSPRVHQSTLSYAYACTTGGYCRTTSHEVSMPSFPRVSAVGVAAHVQLSSIEAGKKHEVSDDLLCGLSADSTENGFGAPDAEGAVWRGLAV